MSEPILPGDYVVLYSDIQDAYHVERRSEYEEKGPTDGNWQIVDSATDYLSGLLKVDERSKAGKDRPK